MPKTRTEHISFPFECAAEGGTVTVHREFRVLLGQGGVEVARAPMTIECSRFRACPTVARPNANSVQYDWKDCPMAKAYKVR